MKCITKKYKLRGKTYVDGHPFQMRRRLTDLHWPQWRKGGANSRHDMGTWAYACLGQWVRMDDRWKPRKPNIHTFPFSRWHRRF